MFWHIDTDIVCLIVIAAVYVCNRKLPKPEGSPIRNRRFSRCLELGIGITVIDIAASIIMEVPTTAFLYHLFMTAYFVCIELAIMEWFLYVLTLLYRDNEKAGKTVARVVVGTYLAYALFIILNPWTGLVYSLGPNNEYSRGPLFGVMLVLFASYTIALFALILIRWKHIPKEYPGGVLLATPIMITVAIAVQLSMPGWLLVMPAYMICLVLAFLFLQTLRVKSSQERMETLSKVAETDQLTGLLNRTGMEAMVHKTLSEAYGKGVLVMIVDIDDLKTINDTMGHPQGDRAIQMVAGQLKKHFRSGDTIVRYGGDEFLVFYTGSINEGQIHSSLQALESKLNELRIGDRGDVPLHGSIGAAYGIVGQDTFESLCSKADIALYHVKRSGKNGNALYKPEMGSTIGI